MTTPHEIPVHLDRRHELPLPVQLAGAVRSAIDTGALRPGDRVPATRDLAVRLGVARGIVVAAYEQLTAEGYLEAAYGRGTRVASHARGARTDPAETTTDHSEHACGDALGPKRPPRGTGTLAPGKPIADVATRPAWRSAWRAAAGGAHGRSEALGDAGLRRAIADHLRQMRGTARSADDVLVTAGTREGLGLVLITLGAGRRTPLVVGVEDPGYPSLRSVASRLGAQTFPLPVDSDGLRTDALPTRGLDAVIVTPSHQYPLGGSLPLARRHELLAWARSAGVVVIEDDYDSELRHVGSPLPALAALDTPGRGVVVTLGTFSSTITPALAAGFLVAPEELRSRLEPVRHDLGSPVSTVVQLALAHYLSSGELSRNVQRMRRLYASRRDRLSDRLAGIAGVRLRPMSGGLHAVVELGDGAEGFRREALVLAGSDSTGLGAESLGRYWQHGDEASAGIVIGVGGSDDVEFDTALESLREILRASSR